MKAAMLFVLVLVATRSPAQTNIALGGSLGTISFTGTGGAGDLTMSWGTLCDPAHCLGEGSGLAFGANGFFSLSGGGDITLTKVGKDAWSVTETSPMVFCFSTAWDCGGVVFIEGNLQLDSLTQYGVLGLVNEAQLPNLAITGGTLESVFGTQAGLSFALAEVDPDLNGLLNSDYTMPGVYVSSASLTPDDSPSVPEPLPLVLLGTALILAAVLLRRMLPSKDPVTPAGPAEASEKAQ